jgi:hypothetical protein
MMWKTPAWRMKNSGSTLPHPPKFADQVGAKSRRIPTAVLCTTMSRMSQSSTSRSRSRPPAGTTTARYAESVAASTVSKCSLASGF